MPQLDFANPLTTYQVLWGAVIFMVLYVLASRIALPKVARCWRSGRNGSPAIWRNAQRCQGERRRRHPGSGGCHGARLAPRRRPRSTPRWIVEAGGRRAVRDAERAAGEATQGGRGPDRCGPRCRYGGAARGGDRYRRHGDHPADRGGAGPGGIERRDRRGLAARGAGR